MSNSSLLPKEIFIRSTTPPVIAAAFATLSILAAPAARADEFDWIYFPMYARDTAHAVHLSSLKFRPDGLLSAATRYPRTSNDGWTGPQSDAGWYNYSERLIDCETGVFVETADSLLDRDGAKLASRPEPREKQLARIESVLHELAGKPWPNNGDVFIACAAASSPTFRQQRAMAAAKVQPLWSDRPLTDVLSNDTDALMAQSRLRYDLARFRKQPQTPASAMFADLRAQYGRWKKSINGAYVPPGTPAVADDKALLLKANEEIAALRLPMVSIKRISGAVVEHAMPVEDFSASRSDQGMLLETALTDCNYGISVPIKRQRLLDAGNLRPAPALSSKAVLADIEKRYGNEEYSDAPGPFDGHQLEAGAAGICELIDKLRRPQALAPEAQGALPFGITREKLEQQPSTEAMLLVIRAARRQQGR